MFRKLRISITCNHLNEEEKMRIIASNNIYPTKIIYYHNGDRSNVSNVLSQRHPTR